jgi:hypothetical protein
MFKRAAGAAAMIEDMATIIKERHIDVDPETAWAALADWGAVHERLVPGFVTAAELDGEDRIVTFFTGARLRERLVTCDPAARRLVWSIVDPPYDHHNGAAQVFADPGGGSRFVWTADVLPQEIAGRTGEMMERGIATIKQTLETMAAAAA